VLGEPRVQRNIVRDAAQQRHRRVGMRIDEAGQEHVLRKLDMTARRITRARLGLRHEGRDPSGVYDERVIDERPRGLDRHDPSGVDA
jgi:hypothetical protein